VSVNNSLYNNEYCNSVPRTETRFVTPVASGKALGCYGLTEAQSGSDAANMRTRAVLAADGSHYLLKWQEILDHLRTRGRPYGDVRRHQPGAKAKRHHAFILAAINPVHSRQDRAKLGIRPPQPARSNSFGYKIPSPSLGEEGKASPRDDHSDQGRVGRGTGPTHRARRLRCGLELCEGTPPFGAPIGSFQMTQAKIADMKTRCRIAIAHAQAAWAKHGCAEAQRQEPRTESSMAKLYASGAHVSMPTAALQIHGGIGTTRSCPGAIISRRPKSPKSTRAPAKFSAS